MNTLWRIVLLFFLSKQVLTYRNEYFLIVSLIFKTSFVKNSISMKTWTLLLFMHVIPNTIRCISLRFDSFQILRIEKNRNLYKFCATSFPPSFSPHLSLSQLTASTDWPALNGTYCRGGRCSSPHQKFSRDLNLYARKWRLLRGFDRKLFPRILSGVQIIPFSPLSCFFYKFKILLRKSDTRLSNCFG